jgi:glycosidase
MVGEAWEGHGTEKQYYKGLISNFEFEYFGQLTKAVGGNAGSYVSSVSGYISDHEAQRSDAITSIFMTNHDQDRAAESFGKNIVKEKQAAAMMLTTSGKPFIYQGEELGYWGKTEKGDPSRRQPMAWDKSLSSLCKFGLSDNHKSDLTDYKMVTGSISVEAQEADAASLLNVYKTWSRLRNTYPALAEGKMSEAPANGGAVASWYMTSTSGQKMLVIHNCGSAEKSITVNDDISKPVAILGTVKADRKTLIISGNSSIVFLL